MPHEFHEWEVQLQPEASSARSGGPPRRTHSVGVLDPPLPPRKPPGPIPAPPMPLWLRVSAVLLLAGLGLYLVYMLLRHF